MLRDGDERDRILGGPANRAKVDAYIDALVAEAPPLTQEQKARLRALMRHTNPRKAPSTRAPVAQAAA